MATKYLDHGAYAAYAATPTWGTPQDGDGTASAASTAAATISLDMSTWTFTSGSSTFSVMGCTALTVSASANSATNAQYSATLTTMIDNLVAAINAATAAVVNVPAGWSTYQVRSTVFARRTGNSLELMTRTGSASWNGLTGITFTNVTNSSSGVWAGGAGGCWGYFINSTGTIWAQAMALGSYGCWGSTNKPVAGVMAAGDVVECRANKVITVTSTSVSMLGFALGAETGYVTFRIDNNSVWADGINKIVEFVHAGFSISAITFTPTSTTYVRILGQRTADGTRNLRLTNTNTGSSASVAVSYGAPAVYECLDLRSATASGNVNLNQGNYSGKSLFVDCAFTSANPSASFLSVGTTFGSVAELIDCEFSNAGAATPHSGVINLGGNASVGPLLRNPKFTNFVVGSTLYTYSSGTPRLQIENPTFGNVTVLGGKVLIVASTFVQEWAGQWVSIISQRGKHDFLIESARGLVEWNSGRSFPTLNATLPDGGKFSFRVLPTTQSGNIARSRPLETPRFGKTNTLADGQRTVKVRFAIEQSLAWTTDDVEILVVYTDTSGALRSMSSRSFSAAALTSDTATWSSQSDGTDGGTAGQVKFDDTGLLFFNKYRIELTTATGADMKQNTEVGCFLRINKSVASASKYLFVDPDFDIV